MRRFFRGVGIHNDKQPSKGSAASDLGKSSVVFRSFFGVLQRHVPLHAVRAYNSIVLHLCEYGDTRHRHDHCPPKQGLCDANKEQTTAVHLQLEDENMASLTQSQQPGRQQTCGRVGTTTQAVDINHQS